jgi:predicted Zn-ribbon and HTH transcriptional regulator
MIKISLNKGFTLPRLGKDTFSMLMRNGLQYDKTTGLFAVKDINKIDKIYAILSEAIKDTISIEVQCVLCSNDAGCSECEFSNTCNRLQVASKCVCRTCLRNGYDNYTREVSKLLE